MAKTILYIVVDSIVWNDYMLTFTNENNKCYVFQCLQSNMSNKLKDQLINDWIHNRVIDDVRTNDYGNYSQFKKYLKNLKNKYQKQ